MRSKAQDPRGQAATGSSQQFRIFQGEVFKQEDSEHKNGAQEID